MFESILIRRHGVGDKSVDVGTLAETLLFYQHVHIVADSSLLSDLLKTIGVDNVLRLLNSNIITLTYVPDTLGVLTTTSPVGLQTYNFAAFRVWPKTKRRPNNTDEVVRTIENT